MGYLGARRKFSSGTLSTTLRRGHDTAFANAQMVRPRSYRQALSVFWIFHYTGAKPAASCDR